MSLELKIPPILLVVLSVILMWGIAVILPDVHLPASLRTVLILASCLLGLFFPIAGVLSFNKAQTTVNPSKPSASSTLVTFGIYQRTRNPMYVGFVFLLFAWACVLSNVFSLLAIILFIIYMNKYQIKPEEDALAINFGQQYFDFQRNVKRWL